MNVEADDEALLAALPDFTRQDLATARRFLRVYYTRFFDWLSEGEYRTFVELADRLDRISDPNGPARRRSTPT